MTFPNCKLLVFNAVKDYLKVSFSNDVNSETWFNLRRIQITFMQML